MKSTGEVMGVGETFAEAFVKSQMAAGVRLPASGKVFISVSDADKARAWRSRASLHELGFELVATRGTAARSPPPASPSTPVNKVAEGRPHIVDMIKNGEIALIVNTVEEKRSAIQDSYQIRRAALADQRPVFHDPRRRAGERSACGYDEQVAYSLQSLQKRLTDSDSRAR